MDSEHNPQPFLSSKYNQQVSLTQNYASGQEEQEEALSLAWVFDVFRRRAWVMVGVAFVIAGSCSALVIKSDKKVPTEYQGGFQLLVEPVTADSKLTQLLAQAGIQSSEGSRVRDLQVDVQQASVDYETIIRVLKSPKLMAPVVETIQAKYPNMNYGNLIKNLKINRVSYEKDGKLEGTKILQIAYTDLNRDKIKFILEKLSETYLQYSLEQRQASLRQGLDFIEKQIPQLYEQVNQWEQQLQNLRTRYGMVNPEDLEASLYRQLENLREEKLLVDSKLAENRFLYSTMKNQLEAGNATLILAQETETYQSLIKALQEINSQIAMESGRLLPDSIPMQVLREKQQNLNLLVQQEAEKQLEQVASQVSGLEARTQNINNTESALQQKIEQLPLITREYTNIQEKLELVNTNLNQFLAKRETFKLDAAQQEIPWELIAPPGQVTSITLKQTRRQLVIVTILSVLLGIGAGFLVEVLHTVFHHPYDVKTATKLPILGRIPLTQKLRQIPKSSKKWTPIVALAGSIQQSDSFNESLPKLDIQKYTSSPVSEAFRSLYTNIYLSNSDRPIHSLVISSAESGDGKSTVAVNLAKTAASIGRRVLLVDADLRQPKLHTKLGLPNLRGLSDAITSDLSLNDAIQRSPTQDNLFVLTAGQIPLDPIKVLSNKKRQYLMEQFQAFFDLVIYDTPPLLGLADSNLMAAHTDGVIIVVRLEKTDRTRVKEALDGFTLSGGSVLGIVANGVKG